MEEKKANMKAERIGKAGVRGGGLVYFIEKFGVHLSEAKSEKNLKDMSELSKCIKR